MDAEQKMLFLIQSFPVIRRGEGRRIKEWSGDFIVRKEGGLKDLYDKMSSSECHVVEFALSVWNQNTDWTNYGYKPFQFARAFARWDNGQRAAFCAWVEDPFFP